MTVSHPPPEAGPFQTREQASAVFGAFAQAAERGRSGPPGEELVFTKHQFLAESLADALEQWAEVGEYDKQLIGVLAAHLDAVQIATIMSWLYRVRNAPSQPEDTEK
jgi:hypothetical protein